MALTTLVVVPCLTSTRYTPGLNSPPNVIVLDGFDVISFKILPLASTILTCSVSELGDLTFKLNELLLGFGNNFTDIDSTTGATFLILVFAAVIMTGVVQAVIFKASVLGLPAQPVDATPCTVMLEFATALVNLTVITFPVEAPTIVAPAGSVHL